MEPRAFKVAYAIERIIQLCVSTSEVEALADIIICIQIASNAGFSGCIAEYLSSCIFGGICMNVEITGICSKGIGTKGSECGGYRHRILVILTESDSSCEECVHQTEFTDIIHLKVSKECIGSSLEVGAMMKKAVIWEHSTLLLTVQRALGDVYLRNQGCLDSSDHLMLVMKVLKDQIRERAIQDFEILIPAVERISVFGKLLAKNDHVTETSVDKPSDIVIANNAPSARIETDGKVSSTNAVETARLHTARVWMQSTGRSSVKHLLILLKLEGYCPSTYIRKIAPHFRQKVSYRGMSNRLKQEILVALLRVFRNAICLIENDSCGQRIPFRTVSSDILRHMSLMGTNVGQGFKAPCNLIKRLIPDHGYITSSSLALLLAEIALSYYPTDNEFMAITARCAIANKDFFSAVRLYREILVLDEKHFEAMNFIESRPISEAVASTMSVNSSHLVAPLFRLTRDGIDGNIPGSVLKSALLDSGRKVDASDIYLEKSVRLSESIIWTMQKKYYKMLGLQAWSLPGATFDSAEAPTSPLEISESDIVKGISGQAVISTTPFYGTSNVYLVTEYARLVFFAIADMIKSEQLSVDVPVYVLELGSGHMRFLLSFIESLQVLFNTLETTLDMPTTRSIIEKMKALQVVIIASDFNSRCLESVISSLDATKMTYVVKGPFNGVNHIGTVDPEKSFEERRNIYLDIAVFDAECGEVIRLKNSEVTLGGTGAERSLNPIFTIANYLFDSLSTDAFALDAGGVLFEGKSTIILKPSVVASDESSLPKASHLTSLDLLQCTQYWNYERVAEMKDQHLNYYGSKSVSTHNENTCSQMRTEAECYILPSQSQLLGACVTLEGISNQHLPYYCHAEWSTNGLILLAADKAVNSIDALLEISYPPIVALHGSLSVTVNFLAIESMLNVLASRSESGKKRALVMHSTQTTSDIDILFSGIINDDDSASFGHIGKKLPSRGKPLMPVAKCLFEYGLCDICNDDLRALKEMLLEEEDQSLNYDGPILSVREEEAVPHDDKKDAATSKTLTTNNNFLDENQIAELLLDKNNKKTPSFKCLLNALYFFSNKDSDMIK